jgi:hypothetical protein
MELSDGRKAIEIVGCLTTSIDSPSAAAFFFSLAFTLAVVERTAVATFATVSFLGGLANDG